MLGWLAVGLAVLRADPVISEFLAANTRVLADDDGKFSDWIEIHNPDATAANLAGWYLTDDVKELKKWQFPAVTIPAGGYLLVWASGENRRDPVKPLHTNFSLDNKGEYLALVKPDGVTVGTEFAPTFPEQFDDISYGVTQPTAAAEAAVRGFLRVPTPGARNPAAAGLFLTEKVTFSRAPGPFAGSFALTLTGAGAGQRIRYTLTAPSAVGAGNAPEPTGTSAEYTGPITISSSVIVRASVYAADNIARGAPATSHYVRIASSGPARVDSFDSQLPVLVIDTHGTGGLVKDGIDHAAWIYAWSKPAAGNTQLASTPTVWTAGTASVRGASSSDFPKKSFSLAALDAQGGNRSITLPGFPSFNNWKLVSAWKYDRTFIANAFIYALSNKLGRWAPRTQLVEVFFNADGGDLDTADYAGIYVLTDSLEVDSKRIDVASLDRGDVGPKSVTGGYVLKIDLPDPDEYSFQLKRGFPSTPVSLIVASTKAADLVQAQKDYIRGHLQAFDDTLLANFAAGWPDRTYLDYIDLPAWIDHHIINVLAMNVDGLIRSEYFTKDRAGRIAAGPVWDFDRSMGGGDVRSQDPLRWSGPDGAADYFAYGWWGPLAQDPEFVQGWIDRWQTLRTRELATANLNALIDSLAAQVGAAAAARDAARWIDNAPRFTGGWSGEIANMKSWLARRAGWIDAQFTPAPTVAAGANGTLVVTPAPGTQLVYTTDGTDPRAFGGSFAHSAKVSSSPVTVAATSDLQARSYRSDYPRNPAPASGWSAAVGGGRSSQITPRARLSNLSSLGFIGAADSPMISGVVVSDTAGKTYLARAVGPSLGAFGVPGTVAQPVLRILDDKGREIARNSGWENSPDANDIPDFAKQVGAFPLAKGSKDAALVARLSSGLYTLQVSSATSATGVGLAELYEIDGGVGRTLNLSTRGQLRTSSDILIGGVVVRGPGPKRLLVRGIGPTLGSFGVPGVLADPVLTIFSGSTVVASNDDWGVSTLSTAAEVAAAATAVGGFPLNPGSKDAALLITLPEGAYTAQVSAKAGGSGVILLEIYEVP